MKGAGLIYTGAIRVDKAFDRDALTIQLRMCIAFDRRWKQTTGNSKQCKSHLTKQHGYPLSTQNMHN